LNHDSVFVIHSLNPKYSIRACTLTHLVGIINFNTITVDATLIKTLDRRQRVLNRDSVFVIHSLNPRYSIRACELIHLVGIINFNQQHGVMPQE